MFWDLTRLVKVFASSTTINSVHSFHSTANEWIIRIHIFILFFILIKVGEKCRKCSRNQSFLLHMKQLYNKQLLSYPNQQQNSWITSYRWVRNNHNHPYETAWILQQKNIFFFLDIGHIHTYQHLQTCEEDKTSQTYS